MSSVAELLAGSILTSGKPLLVCDTECYPNFWSIGFKRIKDGRVVILEKSARKELDRERLRNIMLTHRIVTFNGMNYDMAMIFLAIEGASNERLKQANDKIILGGLKYWEVEDALNVKIPWEVDHIDLIEPQPNAFASLKTLQGRLHGQKMQDLPFHPDKPLTEAEMDITLKYMGNDLDATLNLLVALKEPLELRAALGKQYGMNFMSKSDAQMGEAIIKKRVEQQTGEKVEKVRTPPGTSFPYKIPEYMRFETPQLQAILERLRTTEFFVQGDGSVALPKWLADAEITIGGMTYAMGIGGLHSTEANRALHSDAISILVDFDVASYYPRIILNTGLYPKALGRAFLDVYRKIVDERVDAKRKADDKSLADAIRTTWKAMADGLKIAANGVFGKLGSIWSILYAPHLMVATTLTGQLALLMLIERAAKIGIEAVSGNTDGVVFRVPRSMVEKIEKTRAIGGALQQIIEQWERDTGFTMEATEYRSIYNESVNSYIAVKPDKTCKMKGPLNNPWRDDPGWKPDLRQQLMKNPQMTIVTDAVVDFLLYGTPLEQTVRASRDIRDFVTVVNVKGGGTWRGSYLGKVVRYYWSMDGAEILYKTPHATTGNFKKVSKSDGCQPVMDLPVEFPSDIDYERYVVQAREVLMDIGADRRPDPIRPLKLFKYNAVGWFAVAAA